MGKTIYIDQQFRCHNEEMDGLIPFDTDFFDGREELVEKYRAIPEGGSWTRSDGKIFHGEMITPAEPIV